MDLAQGKYWLGVWQLDEGGGEDMGLGLVGLYVRGGLTDQAVYYLQELANFVREFSAQIASP